jgi:hypothetical protein
MSIDAVADYALKNTKVLYVPDRRIDTFGDTRFNFLLLSEPLDAAGHCRIRSGWIEANRPRILRPADLMGVEMEGFSSSARQFLERMAELGAPVRALVRYGFRFSRSEVTVEYLHERIEEVGERVVREALHSGDAYRTVLQGVDDSWEISLLCFMLEMIQKSHDINFFDFKRRGLL